MDVAKFRRRAWRIAQPAVHTFWQAFAGLVLAWWLASGADLWNQVTDVASAKRFALALLVAAVAAALAAAKATVKAYAARASSRQQRTGARRRGVQ